MYTLLTLTLVVEPDRQRLLHLCLEAVEALGGNVFSAAAALDSLLQRRRQEGVGHYLPLQTNLVLDERNIYLGWDNRRELLTTLAQHPDRQTLIMLSERLKNASESADTALLVQRNRQISADLEYLKQRAAQEMAQLEALLEMKKHELQESWRLAQTDSLTGLFNRGAYDTRLGEAFLRCQRQGEPLSLVLLDLDHFKQINDTYGHRYGDEYLQRMAKTMCSAVREHVDIPCRIGGDEFAIILFSDITMARRVAEGVLTGMEKNISIGIAQALSQYTIESLITRADEALYEAKRRGRGQLVVASAEPSANPVST